MILKDFLYICGGLKYTLIITGIVVFISFYLGLIIGIVRFISKNIIVKSVLTSYISIFRFTPLIFQFSVAISLLIKYIELPILCVIILSLNSSAYISNIILDSLNSVPENYWQTLNGLRISKYAGIRLFLISSILSNAKNGLQSEIINITKESSLVGVIGVTDIFFRSKEVGMLNYEFLFPLCVSGMLYFIINYFQERHFSKILLKFFIISVSKIK
jgi:ABC-type amino acid transport system permease subunit